MTTTHHTDTSQILLRGLRATLDVWRTKCAEEDDQLYWVLELQLAGSSLVAGLSSGDVAAGIPTGSRSATMAKYRAAESYFDDIRYAALEPITQLWGTVVNSLRVAADSQRATAVQKQVFDFGAVSLVAFFRASRERMEVADELYHAFKAMPAPECQALAALLNVHVDATLDADTMCRLVRLLDHEGPMTVAEQEILASLTATKLVDAAFSGLRRRA